MKYFLSLLLCALLVFPAGLSAAQKPPSPVGTIAEIEGIVAIAEGDNAAVPETGDDIYLNDVIETGPGAKALIVFIDETELTLGENARLKIDEYVFDADNTEDHKGRFSIPRGAFIMATGLIGKRQNPDVKIETAYGAIGIRGTVVWGGPLDDQYNIFVQEGEVTFSTERGRVTLRPGQGTFVQSRRAIPARAKEWEQEKIRRAVQTVALKNKESIRQRVLSIKERHKNMRGDHQKTIRDNRQQLDEKTREERRILQKHRQDKGTEYRPVRPAPESKIKEMRGGVSTPQEIERLEKMHLRDQEQR